jgi:uncharacterized protein (TIGR00288 family)
VQAPNAALLIDFDNVTMGIQKDMQAELRNLLSSDIIRGKVSVQRAYADWRRYPGYIVPLTEASIDLIFAPAYGSAKKNATDIRLAVDAMELVFTRPEIGTFILLSGDSDFSSLVLKLKEYGKYVIGVGIRESASDLLVQNCDEYYSYNALAGLVKSGDEETKRWDPYELVAEAVQRMARNGDVMRADRLKQVMQDIDVAFDEKDLGMAKFSRFVTEAEHRGLLTVTRLDSGQYEIAPGPKLAPAREPAREPTREMPRDAGRDAARETARDAALDEAEADAERGDRLERGRRRGRGRGRGREFEREPARFPRPDEAEPDVDGAPPKLRLEDVEADAGPAPAAAPAIGRSGERLTRAEAFDLVRRAVESLTRSADDAVDPPAVREEAFALLGRDSESLGDRMFDRIIRDAADAGLVALRRDGDAVALLRAEQAPANVADQLNRASAAAQGAPAPADAGPAVVRGGMGPRGLPRGRGGRAAAGPPPELLLLGAVQTAAPAAALPDSAPEVTNAGGSPVETDFAAIGAGADVASAPAVEAPTEVSVEAAPPAVLPPLQRGGLRGRGRGGRPGGPPAPEVLLTGVVATAGAVAPRAAAPSLRDAAPERPVVDTAPASGSDVVAVASSGDAPATAPSDATRAPDTVDVAAPDSATPASPATRGRGRGRGRGGARKAAAKQPAAPAAAPSPPPPAPAATPAAPAAAKQPAAKQPGARQPAAKQPAAKQSGARKAAAPRERPAAPAPAQPTAAAGRPGRPAAKRGARKAAAKRAE